MSRSDKTEKPTPKRKREARRDGQIARSPELGPWASVLAASMLVQVVMANANRTVRHLLTTAADAARRPDPTAALGLLSEGLKGALLVVAPLALGLTVLGVVLQVAQVGFAPTSKAFKPKFDRLNPVQGLKRLLSTQSLWEAGKTLVKFALLALLVYRTLGGVVPKLVGSGKIAVPDVVAMAGAESLRLVRNMAVLGLVLAAGDYGYQRRKLNKSLSMTKQEVKEEFRQAEGDPHVKGAIRQRQAEMSRQRMMAEVARADVVVVNPVHVAVALRYEADKGAPRVVAKGAGPVAARIREEAERHRVPMVEDVGLARTLHAACELGAEIPAELYEAVARVLAFIFALRARGPVLGIRRLPASPPPL